MAGPEMDGLWEQTMERKAGPGTMVAWEKSVATRMSRLFLTSKRRVMATEFGK